MAQQRDHFRLALPQLAVRPSDISRAVLEEKPAIVHFSGHGTAEGQLCFEDATGKVNAVEPEALTALFQLVSNHVKCVVMNACYSATQSEGIAQHIDYVVGMDKAISDKAAITFAVGFYQALGAGKNVDVDRAYKFGCVQIRLQGVSEHLTPVLRKRQR